jgi:GAF domain-containing protein
MVTTGNNTNDAMNLLASRIMALLSSGKPSERMITDIVLMVQEATGMESVGLRLIEEPDFPYYFTRGFDQDFVEKEMHLCARDQLGELIRDSDGNPVLECMCGNVICGRTDPSYPFFTEGGSFWSNCTTGLLASTSEDERQSRTRNRCNSEGYESVALIPVKVSGKRFGLLQLNDHRKEMFTKELICFLEGVTVNIGLLFSMHKMTEQLASQAADVTRTVAVRGELLKRLADELRGNAKELTAEREESILTKIDALLEEVETLKGIAPICCVCKRVRIDTDYWTQVETFVRNRSKLEFSHTYCPVCAAKALEELEDGG